MLSGKPWVYSRARDGSHYGPCPLAGQRAVELATGVIYHLLDDLRESYVREILENNQRLDLAAIENTLQRLGLKLQCWTQLPWKLAALASVGTSLARQKAKEWDWLQNFHEKVIRVTAIPTINSSDIGAKALSRARLHDGRG